MTAASWTNVNGTWAIKVLGPAKTGDQVVVRSRNGNTTVELGRNLGGNVYAKAGRQSAVRPRAVAPAYDYYVHEGNDPMSPLEAWHASLRGC